MSNGIVFELFRLELEEVEQHSLEKLFLTPEFTRTGALREVLTERPSNESRWGTWTLANVEQIHDYGYYFRIGRITRRDVQAFVDGNFVDVSFENAPYTHAFLDVHHQFLAVARNPKVATTAKVIASRFSGIITHSETLRAAGFRCSADPIPDPTEVVERIRQAIKINQMWLTFRRPNHFDEEEDFRAPMKKTLSWLAARSGTTSFSGDIDKKRAEELTRASAAAGDDVTVQFEEPGTAIRQTISTKTSSAVVFAQSLFDSEIRSALFIKMVTKYQRLRGLVSNPNGRDEENNE